MLKTIFIITTLLIPLFAFTLGIFCLIKNAKSKVVILWFLTCMAAGIWGLGLLCSIYVKTYLQALNSYAILFIGAILIPVLFYHFTSSFLFNEKKNKSFLITGYTLATVFITIIIFKTALIIKIIYLPSEFIPLIKTGYLYVGLLFYFWIYIVVSFYLLMKGYKRSNGINKKQIFYILLGAIFGFGGGATYFLTDLYGIYPYGGFFIFLFFIMITYGMFLKKY